MPPPATARADAPRSRARDADAAPAPRRPAPRQLAASIAGTCLVRAGRVFCWGDASLTLLPAGAPKVPTAVEGVDDAVEVAVGHGGACATTRTGRVLCWGLRSFVSDHVATGYMKPTPIGPLAGATSIAVSSFSRCGANARGAVACVGQRRGGAIGLPHAVEGAQAGVLQLVSFGGSTEVKALLAGGAVGGWREDMPEHSTLELAPGLARVRQVAAGAGHSCAVDEGGRVACWGWNDFGQLGHGSVTPLPAPSAQFQTPSTWAPAEARGAVDAVAVAAGERASYAVRRDGTVLAWGDNRSKQLGDAAGDVRTTPAPVPGLTKVVAVAAGKDHACALRDDGRVLCWGGNARGERGTGGPGPDPVPAEVTF